MSDDPDEIPWDDEDDDDDEDVPLPVISANGTVLAAPVVERKRGLRKRQPNLGRRYKGNTKAGDASMKRDQVMREAKGTVMKDPDEWRDQLGQGDRGKAGAALYSTELTHNAGSGFGLA